MDAKDIVLLIVVIVIVGHKLFVPMLLSPFILLAAYFEKKAGGTFQKGRNLLEKGRNFYVNLLASLKDRLCLYWIAQIPSHHLRNFFYRYVYLVQMKENVIICWSRNKKSYSAENRKRYYYW